MNRLIRLILLIVSVLSFVNCGGGDNPGAVNDTEQRGSLVSATVVNDFTLIDLYLAAQVLDIFPGNRASMTYDVSVHRLVYWTVDHNGNPVKASGLVATPEKSAVVNTALLSFHHGTVFHDTNAPTNNSNYDLLAAMMASMDFIVTVPDYLGYGESAALIHPYLHAGSSSTVVIDLLRATKQWLHQSNIGVNDQLFLGGYSEGGYVTLATHRAMQEDYAGEFSVTASAPGAGPYDLTGTLNSYLGDAVLPYAPYIAFVFRAYDEIYAYDRITDFFQPAYVDPVNNYFYGNHTGVQINAALTNVTTDLFNATFLEDFRGTGEDLMKADIAANDLYDWIPTSPVRFYHGADDVDVPYANATTAVTTMVTNGATDITLIDCSASPASHSNCAEPYLDDMIGYFLTF